MRMPPRDGQASKDLGVHRVAKVSNDMSHIDRVLYDFEKQRQL